jgi:hypothetical protein
MGTNGDSVLTDKKSVLCGFGQYQYNRAIDTLWMNSPSRKGQYGMNSGFSSACQRLRNEQDAPKVPHRQVKPL